MSFIGGSNKNNQSNKSMSGGYGGSSGRKQPGGGYSSNNMAHNKKREAGLSRSPSSSMPNPLPIGQLDEDAKQMNLTTLQRVDPYITDILTYTAQVAVYKFVSANWERTDTQGALFVYVRQCKPLHGFFVLNSRSPVNIVQPLSPDLEFQIQTPFLLYKTKEGEIFGIWFYNKSECNRISKILTTLCTNNTVVNHEIQVVHSQTQHERKQKENRNTSKVVDVDGKTSGIIDTKDENGMSNDLMSLLSRAKIQEEHELNNNDEECVDTNKVVSIGKYSANEEEQPWNIGPRPSSWGSHSKQSKSAMNSSRAEYFDGGEMKTNSSAFKNLPKSKKSTNNENNFVNMLHLSDLESNVFLTPSNNTEVGNQSENVNSRKSKDDFANQRSALLEMDTNNEEEGIQKGFAILSSIQGGAIDTTEEVEVLSEMNGKSQQVGSSGKFRNNGSKSRNKIEITGIRQGLIKSEENEDQVESMSVSGAVGKINNKKDSQLKSSPDISGESGRTSNNPNTVSGTSHPNPTHPQNSSFHHQQMVQNPFFKNNVMGGECSGATPMHPAHAIQGGHILTSSTKTGVMDPSSMMNQFGQQNPYVNPQHGMMNPWFYPSPFFNPYFCPNPNATNIQHISSIKQEMDQMVMGTAAQNPPLLQKDQFLKAFQYLLKNDTTFSNKLYTAYVKGQTSDGDDTSV